MSVAISDRFERFDKLPRYGQAEQSLVTFLANLEAAVQLESTGQHPCPMLEQSDQAVARRLALSRVLYNNMVIVIGPTPPGTGVMAAALRQAAAKSTSPISFFSSTRFTPTSITTAPGLIQSPLIICGLPTAAISTSAAATFC